MHANVFPFGKSDKSVKTAKIYKPKAEEDGKKYIHGKIELEMGAITRTRKKRTNRSFYYFVLFCSLTTTKARAPKNEYINIEIDILPPLPSMPLKTWMNASHRLKYYAYATISLRAESEDRASVREAKESVKYRVTCSTTPPPPLQHLSYYSIQ